LNAADAEASGCLAVVKVADSGENPPMQGKRKAPAAPRRVLVIDVGGAHVKFRVGAHGPIQKFTSGPTMRPEGMIRRIVRLTRATPYDRVSIGYPGLVFRDRVAAEPHNLGKGWTGFDFARALGKPVRIINDAAMQAIGSYSGGRMLFLGLGTGLGATLIIDGVVEPTEVGHMPFRRGRSFEDWVGERGRERLGNRAWRKAVDEVVAALQAAFETDYIVLGGGNARRLKKLPPRVRLGDNRNAFIGGLRLWQRGAPALPAAATGARRRRRR
jgi:polyphosphate glucokinase